MQKEVTRKEFLSILGLVLCSILGFGRIIELLTGKSLETHDALRNNAAGRIYGGKKS